MPKTLVGAGYIVMDVTHVVCAPGELKVLFFSCYLESPICLSNPCCLARLPSDIIYSMQAILPDPSLNSDGWSPGDLVSSASRSVLSPPYHPWCLAHCRAAHGACSASARSQKCKMVSQKDPKRTSLLRLSLYRRSHA